MKKISIMVISMLVFLITFWNHTLIASDSSTTSEANIPSETSAQITDIPAAGVSNALVECLTTHEAQVVSVRSASLIVLQAEEREKIETSDIEELNTLISECEDRIEAAKQMEEACIILGYDEDDSVLILSIDEQEQANQDLVYYQELLKEAKKSKQAEEYPVATEVWNYLTQTMGLNEYVAAGILGNMMAEAGGQTLDLNPYAYNNGYYGLCQWSLTLYGSVANTNTQGQLNYLNSNIEQQFESHGELYALDFTYESFKVIQDEQIAALVFAKVYERCTSGSYQKRRENATIAYKYFT